VARRISGHRSRNVFDRYNIVSERDLQEAASRLGSYIEKQKAALKKEKKRLGTLLAHQAEAPDVTRTGKNGKLLN